ncbi:MAG: RNA polymerase sigma factor [Bacteroidales bacterium]|jgi:RNA polymerase sigma-70 factor (ECF subfamily)|nr:RNA polymerase sigma factor [Bacteroidales bacterium]
MQPVLSKKYVNSDKELQKLCDSGLYRQAFEEIVQLYSKRLYWHIRKMVLVHDDADDVLQNTLIKAWTGLPGFRWESQLFTWLYRIATNEVLTFLKKNKALTRIPLEERLEADAPLFSGDRIQEALQEAIRRLPAKQRLVFTMRYFEEIRYEDMSQILGTSVGSLKASYHHAFTKVQKTLRELLL